MIKTWFIRYYKVETGEAELPLNQYETLGAFFIRRLKPGARVIDQDSLVSPVDGTLTQGGSFQPQNPRLTQIKGLEYQLEDLIGPGWNIGDYRTGGFLTVYLAPYNYHRIHSPIEGQVTQVSYIPGALWPVNSWSVTQVPGLFVVNERIIVELTGTGGKALVVMVGATNVGRITLDFLPSLIGNSYPQNEMRIWNPPQPISIQKGQGLGCFELGSTVILILSKEMMAKVSPSFLNSQSRSIRMGQGLAT